MCDPISAIALAGSAVAAGINYQGQQATQEAQQNANDQWVAYQRAAAATAAAKDAANRQKAQGALGVAEKALSPANQGAVQQGAAANLNTAMLAGSPAASDSNIALLGGPSADTSVTSDMAQRVTSAAREAQGRIAALAGLTSYGGGYGDMGAAATQSLANSADTINLTGNMRKGDTATLGVAQQVQPVKYVQGSDVAGTVASGLANIAGNAFASSGAGQSLRSALGR